MDWRSAVVEVAKYAPAVATALGGPAVGGAATGAALMVTSALGIENDPAALVAATQDPAKRAELVRLNNEHRQALEAMRLEAEKAAKLVWLDIDVADPVAPASTEMAGGTVAA